MRGPLKTYILIIFALLCSFFTFFLAFFLQRENIDDLIIQNQNIDTSNMHLWKVYMEKEAQITETKVMELNLNSTPDVLSTKIFQYKPYYLIPEMSLEDTPQAKLYSSSISLQKYNELYNSCNDSSDFCVNTIKYVNLYTVFENKSRYKKPINYKLTPEYLPITHKIMTEGIQHTVSTEMPLYIDCGSKADQFEEIFIIRREQKNVKKVKVFNEEIYYAMVAIGDQQQHFIIDVIPKIIQGIDILRDNKVKIMIVYSSKKSKNILPLMDLLKINRSRIILSSELDNQGYNFFRAPKIYVNCQVPIFHPYFHKKARELMGLPLKPKKLNKIIYLPRRKTKQTFNRDRFVENNDEVLSLITNIFSKEFEVVEFLNDNYTDFNEILRLFADAVLIVGIHSGTFLNCFYAPKTAIIFEIFPKAPKFFKDIFRHYWYILSNFIGQRYYYTVGSNKILNKKSLLRIDLKDLEENLLKLRPYFITSQLNDFSYLRTTNM